MDDAKQARITGDVQREWAAAAEIEALRAERDAARSAIRAALDEADIAPDGDGAWLDRPLVDRLRLGLVGPPGMTDDPHIAVIGPLALACLRGECPPEILEDKVEETGWSPPQEVRADRIRRLWARWPWKIADETECSLLAIVAYWRECQATAALRDAPPDGAGTYYHETPR